MNGLPGASSGLRPGALNRVVRASPRLVRLKAVLLAPEE